VSDPGRITNAVESFQADFLGRSTNLAAGGERLLAAWRYFFGFVAADYLTFQQFVAIDIPSSVSTSNFESPNKSMIMSSVDWWQLISRRQACGGT
jgi:hypothetical protein